MFFENFDEFKQFFFENEETTSIPKKVTIDKHDYHLEFNNTNIVNFLETKELHAILISETSTPIGIKWILDEDVLLPKIMKELNIPLTIFESQQQVIGDTVEVSFSYFSNSKPIRGKVDTGADVCSLHVSKWNSSNNRVTFVAPHLSNNTITAPLSDNQAVKSADGGVEYRPVVEFDITINGKELRKVAFNLNDRSQMEYPILIGQNALEQGKFLVNPSATESIDWEQIKSLLNE